MNKDNYFTFELDPESMLSYKILLFAETFNKRNVLRLEDVEEFDSSELDELDEEHEEDDEDDKNIDYSTTLPYGITNIVYKAKDEKEHEIIFDYQQIKNTIVTSYGKVIYVKSLSMKSLSGKSLLIEFCKESLVYYRNKVKKECIPCYILNDGYWSKRKDIQKRNLNTIYLEDEQIDGILNDLHKFMDSKDRYKNFGIPYKRNYLLTGLPGTGKTSLVRALASKYDKGIAYLSFSAELTDSKFNDAISRLPKNCFLLLEDFDSLFVKRESNDKDCHVSFSSVLNALDGILTNNKQITFITTNHIEQLDQALKRASRIDYIMKFSYLSKGQVKKMFKKYFPENKNCDKFIKEIKNDLKKMTPSMLQHYFNKYYEDDIFEKLDKLRQIMIEFNVNNNIMESMYN